MIKCLIIALTNPNLEMLDLEFVRPIEQIIEGHEYEILKLNELDLLEDILKENDFSHIILSGTSLKDDYFLNFVDNFNVLKYFEGFILGICAGAQVLYMIFEDLKIRKLSRYEEIGVFNSHIEKSQFVYPILDGVNLDKVYNLHSFCFGPIKKFKVVAKTQIPNFIEFESRVFAVLFHPEVLNKELVKNFINLEIKI